jgi:hypothetical protein
MSLQTLRGTQPWFAGRDDPQTELKMASDYAPRAAARYACPKGHDFEVPFSDDAEVPPVWECRRHGTESQVIDDVVHPQQPVKAPRTHWDMLRERRSIPELQVLLDERLAELTAIRTGTH